MLTSPAFGSGVRHAFFTREGGVSDGVYASLNCGLGSGDDRANVRENRRRAAARLDLPEDSLVTLRQVHSGQAVPIPGNERARADGMATNRPGVLLGVLAADCAPVLLADEENGVIGAAHAGWRGALAGIVESTVAEMEKLGARRKAIAAAVGPCIAQESYQVDAAFRDRFVADGEGDEALFRPDIPDGKYLFDLRRYVRGRLERARIGRIDLAANDTFSEAGLFFSYRRSRRLDEDDCGRGLSAIALDECRT